VESQNYYHFHDNRVLPSHVDEALANSEGGRAQGCVCVYGCTGLQACVGVCAGVLEVCARLQCVLVWCWCCWLGHCSHSSDQVGCTRVLVNGGGAWRRSRLSV
jgi:hypothetical protein